MKDIAGQALRMNAHEWRHRFHIACDQSDSLFRGTIAIAARRAKAVNAKVSPAGRKVRGGERLYFVFTHAFIIAAGCVCEVAHLAAGAEREDSILLGRDRSTV